MNIENSPEETLESILNEPEETVEAKTESTAAPEAELPGELQWDEDEESTPAPDEDVEVAPEDADDEELAKIEEKNEWMKKRLAPTKEKLTKAEQEIAKLREELEAVKAGKPVEAPPAAQQQAPAASLDEYIANQIAIDPVTAKLQKDFSDLENKEGVTNGELIRAAAKLEARKELLADSIKSGIAAQRQQIVQTENQLTDNFHKTVLSKKDAYPTIDKALARVEKNAEHLNIDIRRALIMDDNGTGINPLAPDLVNTIGNDKQALGYLIAQSKLAAKTGRTPVAALEYIGRLKARAEAVTEENTKAPDQIEGPRKSALPKMIRQTSVSEPIDLDAWATEALRKGERPW